MLLADIGGRGRFLCGIHTIRRLLGGYLASLPHPVPRNVTVVMFGLRVSGLSQYVQIISGLSVMEWVMTSLYPQAHR